MSELHEARGAPPIAEFGLGTLRCLETSGEYSLTQAALRFVLDEPAVSGVIPGIKTMAQAEENLAASTIPSLTDTERRAIFNVLEGAMDDLL